MLFFERVKIQRGVLVKIQVYNYHSELHSLKCRGLQSSKNHKTTYCCFNAGLVYNNSVLWPYLSKSKRTKKGQILCWYMLKILFSPVLFVVLFRAWHTWSQWTVSVIELNVIVVRFFRIFLLCSLEEINAEILNDMRKATPSTTKKIIITLPSHFFLVSYLFHSVVRLRVSII